MMDRDARGDGALEDGGAASASSVLSTAELAEIERISKEVVDSPLPLAIIDGIGEQIVERFSADPMDPTVVRQEVASMYLREVRRHPELSLGGDAKMGQHAAGLVEALDKQVDESFDRMHSQEGGALPNKEIRL